MPLLTVSEHTALIALLRLSIDLHYITYSRIRSKPGCCIDDVAEGVHHTIKQRYSPGQIKRAIFNLVNGGYIRVRYSNRLYPIK